MNSQIHPSIYVDKYLIDIGYALLDTSKQDELNLLFTNLIHSLKNVPSELIDEREKSEMINKLFEELMIIKESVHILKKNIIKGNYSVLFLKTVNVYLKIID